MSTHTYVNSVLEPGDSDLTPASQGPGSWLPAAARCGATMNPRLWQTRAARGISWHRAGVALRREFAR